MLMASGAWSAANTKPITPRLRRTYQYFAQGGWNLKMTLESRAKEMNVTAERPAPRIGPAMGSSWSWYQISNARNAKERRTKRMQNFQCWRAPEKGRGRGGSGAGAAGAGACGSGSSA